MACQITFSRYPAAADLPEHGIVAGNWYWASDQELPDENGNLVRLVGVRFLQPQDESPPGEPPLFAGNAYLKYDDCTQSEDGGIITCQLGACIVGDCCYETLEDLCPGEFQGPNTVCELPQCFDVGACCGAIHSIDCIETTRITCPTDWFGAGRTCDEAPPYCRGACCIFDLNKGTLCVDNIPPSECRDIQDFQTIWTVWLGPETECATEHCPDTGGCCRPPDWQCENTTPDDCEGSLVFAGSVFMGLGNFCGPDTCNGACCADISQEPGAPSPFIPGCVDDVTFEECGIETLPLLGAFLGPGTNCFDNAGDCGVCCLINPASGQMECRQDLLQTECFELGGVPFGPDSRCEICDTVRRACCVPSTAPAFITPGIPGPPGLEPPEGCRAFTCTDVSNRDECTALHGIFNPESDCAGIVFCFIDHAACCCPDPDNPGECFCENMSNCVECPSSCVCHNGAICTPAVPTPGANWRCLVDCNAGNNCQKKSPVP